MYLGGWCLLAIVFPTLSAASSARSSFPVERIRDDSLVRGAPGPLQDINSEHTRLSHALHAAGNNLTAVSAHDVGEEDWGMVAAGRKADAQRDIRAGRGESATIVSQLAVMPFTSLALTPPASASAFVASPIVSELASPPRPIDQVQTHSEPLPPSQSASSPTSPSNSSSSMNFPPALLAFILLLMCLFTLVVFLALRRIYSRKGTRVPIASPLFLGDMTGMGSVHHRSEAIALCEPKMKARDAVPRHGHSKKKDKKADPFPDGGSISETSTFTSIHSGIPTPLPAFHVTASVQQPPRSRAQRPYVPRPYHRPHPACTMDPEAVMPLIPREGSENIGVRGAGMKGKGEATSKGKGKENAEPNKPTNQWRRRRDTLSATSQYSVRPFSSVNSTVPISTAKPEFPVSSVMDIRRSDSREDVIPPLPSGSTAADIGLAMLRDFSSPHVGLGLELCPKSAGSRPRPHSQQDTAALLKPDALQTAEKPIENPATDVSGEGTLPYLAESTSSGSKGLAYLASTSSRGLMISDKTEGRDITENDLDVAAALAVYRAENARVSFEAQEARENPTSEAKLVAQDSLDTPMSANARGPVPGVFKAPTLPTLSEMALSRADPLYESVTNELFASYGVRMSATSGAGRMSRVSARISKMLSWFGDAGAGDRLSAVSDGLPGVEERTSGERERLSSATMGGVQPLRIGKMRKSPE